MDGRAIPGNSDNFLRIVAPGVTIDEIILVSGDGSAEVDQSYQVRSKVEYHPTLRRDQAKLHLFGNQVFPGI